MFVLLRKIVNKIKNIAKTLLYSFLSTIWTIVQPKPKMEDIIEVRKNIKIYDIFIFFNEIDLLEIRLNILDPYVDHFVIIEATKTFTGLPKKLFYEENKNLFKKWEHKIIHYVVNDIPKNENDLIKRLKNKNLDQVDEKIIKTALKSSNIPHGEKEYWLREFYQKEMMKKPLVGIAKDEDMCFVSDIDEIWNPKAKIDYNKNTVFKYKQKVYAYYLNNRSSERWKGTFATKYRNIKKRSLNHLDTPSKTIYTYIKNGGWHFTNMGGIEKLKQKIEAYSHQEFNNEKIKGELEKRINENTDFVGRNFNFWQDESELPIYLLENKEKYREMFK